MQLMLLSLISCSKWKDEFYMQEYKESQYKTMRKVQTWEFPEGFDHEAAKTLVRESARPLGVGALQYLTALARVKKLPEADEKTAERILKTYMNDLKDYCELSVITALNDIRKDGESPFFPTVAEIRKKARDYHRTMIMTQEYLNDKN